MTNTDWTWLLSLLILGVCICFALPDRLEDIDDE
jgi:hypothetical protein